MKKKNGFTIIETTVAIGILAVGLLAVVQVFPFGTKMTRISRHITVANNIAQGIMDEELDQAYEDMPVGTSAREKVSPNPNDPFYIYEKEITVEYINGDLDYSTTDLGMKKIIVKIYWQEQGQQKQTQLATITTNK